MNVAFDAVMLSVYLHPTAKPPKPVPDLPARIQLLIDDLEAAGAKIIIPAPILSEFLVMAGPKDGAAYLAELTNNDVFDIRPFDTMAAVEAAFQHRKAVAAGDKKAGSESRWQVVKVDRQLVAIATVNGVTCIYSDDDGVRKLAAAAGIDCKGVDDLPIPPVDPQAKLPLEEEKAPTKNAPSASIASALPSGQSPAAGKARGPQPAPPRRAIRLAGPMQPPPDSSPAAPRRSRSKK